MTKKKNPLVFMDVSVDGDPVERMVFEVLFVIKITSGYIFFQRNE